MTLTFQNILSGFRATGIWSLKLEAMTLKATPNEAFVNQEEDKEQKKQILKEDIFDCKEGIVHFYGSQEEVV